MKHIKDNINALCEGQDLLKLGAGDILDYDRGKTVVNLLVEQAGKTPDAVAVVDKDSQLTYRELDDRSNALAHWLIEEKCVLAGGNVAVMMPRVKEFVVAVFGIWKAGAAYVPIDVTLPEQRRSYILSDCESKTVVTRETISILKETGTVPVDNSATEGPAYVIYTSGSTGLPKGAVIGHKAFMSFTAWANKYFNQREGSKHLVHAGFSFDISIIELLCPLAVGGESHILSEDVRMDINSIAGYINANGINGATFPTSVGMLLLNSCDVNLEYAVLAGEKMYPVRKQGIRVFNDYGPCEFGIGSTLYELRGDESEIPIGRPVPNCCAKICDADGHLVPRGQSGELYLGGVQLGLGYINRPELNREKYVDGWYRTGDLCRWNADGNLEYIGRIDNQVKVRGFRIELVEIESLAMQVDGVIQIAATVKDDMIVLYWCGRALENVIRSHLAESLPEYMLLSAYMHLDVMPLNHNGKIDRKRLREIEVYAGETVAPRNLLEQELADIISETVSLGRFGVKTNLISVGMTSISAMRIAVKVSHRYGVHVRMTDFMSNPTVDGLSSLLDTGSGKETHFGITYPIKKYYPLTPNQLGVYIDWENNRDGLQYNVPRAIRFKGVDFDILKNALTSIIDAHPVLKMRLAIVDGMVMQHRDDSLVPYVTVSELPKLTNEGIQSFFQSRVRPFDLFGDSLYRFELYRSGEDCYLFKDIHHIVTDGLSEGRLLWEIMSAIKGESVIAENYTAYDYSLELERYIRTEGYVNDGMYFEKLLNGLTATSYPESINAIGAGNSSCVSIEIEKSVIYRKCAEQGVTSSNYILHSVTQVLKSITRDDRVLIAVASNGREYGCMENCQGFFVKTLPVVSADSVQTLQCQMLASISHEEYPLTEMVERLGIRPQIMYAYGGELGVGASASDIETIPLSLNTPKFPLSIFVNPDGADSFVIELEYDDGKYSESDMKTLLRCMSNMAVSGRLVSEEEERSLIALGTGERLDYDRTQTFVDLFIEQVGKTPDAVAVVDKDSQITYRELDEQSNALAHWLIEEKGIIKDDFVTVMLPRRKEFVISILGIMKAGAAYVPIDPEYPEERKRFMIEDSGAKVTIVEGMLHHISTGYEKTPVNGSTPEGLVYMIYTSGSTGRPKGVMIQHRSLLNFIQFQKRYWPISCQSRVSSHASFSFDASIEDLFVPFTVGASLHIMPEDIRSDAEEITDYIKSHGISGGSFVTPIGEVLLQSKCLKMDYLIVGGEKLTRSYPFEGQLFNTYGPTEFTIDATWAELKYGMEKESVPPIGRPLPNLYAFVLNPDMDLVPRGILGELCLAGIQISAGYWHRPELTDEKFVDCPFIKGQKMYRTGDLVRWNEDGQLEFIGRIDNQVKIRGFRVELGEIESAAANIGGISRAVAMVKDDTLCLYYTGEATESSIREELSKTLAGYMIPSICIKLEQMPLNHNGKIDRNRLPEVEGSGYETVAPRTLQEQELAEIISETASLGCFGVTTNLISVGMTSISAMCIAVKVSHRYGTQVRMTEFMAHPTVEGLSTLIDAVSGRNSHFGEVYPLQEYYPLTANQLGVYIDWEKNRDAVQYNLPNVLRIRNTTSSALCQSLRSIINAHPILKAHLVQKNGEIVLQRRDGAYIGITGSSVSDDTDLKVYFKDKVRPFNLLDDDLCRFETVECGTDLYLFYDIHHIISDGLSQGIFLHELEDSLSGQSIAVESYTAYDFALELSRYAGIGSYRHDVVYFSGLIGDRVCTQYPLSVMVGRDVSRSGISRMMSHNMPENNTSKACSRLGVTPSSWMLCMLLEVVRRFTGESAPMVVFISNGRIGSRMERTHGFFTSTLPAVWSDNPKSMQRQQLTSISHQTLPFTEMVERNGIHPQIMFVYEGQLGMDLPVGGHVERTEYSLDPDTVKVPLTVFVYPQSDGGYNLVAEYDGTQYSANDMRTLLSSMETLSENYSASVLAAAPDNVPSIKSVSLLTEAQEKDLLSLGNGKSNKCAHDKTVVDMFIEQARKTPDAVAVVFKDRRYTYSAVDAITDRIAEILMHSGVGHETVVGIKIGRSEKLVLYPLAVMKAGGTYMPLDAGLPSKRLSEMCGNAGVQLILTENGERNPVEGYSGTVIPDIENMSVTNRYIRPKLSPEDRYVILYTSGSSGMPKGVELEHHGLANFCRWYIKEFDMVQSDKSLSYASFGFDAHMMDIYPALCCGSSVYILPSEFRLDVNLLNRYLEENGITIAFLTTQLGRLFVNSIDNHSLRLLSVSGERLLPVKKPCYRLYNAGGPTECTIYAFFYPITSDYATDVIGRPLDNVNIYIVDGDLKLVPHGVVGEMLVGGQGVGRGYINNTSLTEERFLEWNGDRVYRTGDMCRWNEDGNLEYKGRIDNQVKVRGFRIELGEIESVAMQVDGVSQIAATVKDDMIVLYWCGRALENGIRSHLEDSLPEYMLPLAYMHLDVMPFNQNGKIDRKRLPEVVMKSSLHEAPSSDLEQLVYDAVSAEIGCNEFGVNDNLISYGLSSIKAMRLGVALTESGINVRVAEILSHPTVREIAELAGAKSMEARQFRFRTHEFREYYPLTENQRLLYLSWVHNDESIQYNMPMAWYIPIGDVERMYSSMIAVINAHPHLKTHLVFKDGDIMQQRRDDCALNVTIVDTGSELTADYVQSRIRPFNLNGGDLYRVEIHRTSRDTHRACVIMDVHHIITDGLSMQIFHRDLHKAMAGQMVDAEKYSAYDYAIDLQETAGTVEYDKAEKWFDNLISGKDVTVYPHSYEGLEEPALASLVSEFDGNAVDEYCKKYGFTQSNFFLTAFLYLLREVTGDEDLLITTINHGRHSSCMKNTIGMFVSTLPVSVSCKSPIWHANVKEAVEMVHRQLIQTQDYDFYPFTLMVERHGIHAEIMYEYQGEITDIDNEGIPDSDTIDISLDLAKLPLMLSVDHGGKNGAYRFLVRYDRSAYSGIDMDRMLGMFSLIAETMPQASSMDSIDLLDKDDFENVLCLSTGPHMDLDIGCTFAKAFRECAASHADSPAVEDENGIHSYAELDNSSDVLAKKLLDAGVNPDDFVALLFDRTWYFPMSIIAVHKAGAAYVPLDLGNPVERLQQMLDDSQAKVLLTTRTDFESKRQNGLGSGSAKVIFLENLDLSVKAEPIDISKPAGNAFMVYTSGSTGKPKGAVIHQAGLWNLICSVRNIYGMTEKDRIASHRTFSFVSHAEDVFVILSVGGSLHIMPSCIRKDLDKVHEYLESHKITGCGFIASVTMLLLKNYKLDMRYITGGGETLSGVTNTGMPQIIHSYGPTESTVHTSVFLLEKGKEYDRIPVGKPLPNNWMFVVSPNGKLLPRGIAGELCFAGIQVAKGYWNQPELTAGKFGSCPFVSKDRWGRPVRMYHTGDLVRWNENGYLEHIGRIDNQFKVRGFRIEPGEIENVAHKCDGVKEAVAVIRNEMLVLYYTGEMDIKFDWGTLPDYMRPSVCMHLDLMPLNHNGKIDRKHLPEPLVSDLDGHVPPSTERERFVFSKVKELLDIDNFGVTDDLMLYGMNSIRAMRLALELPREWGITVSNVMASRTIRDMISEQHDMVWFRREYDSSKKTVVLVAGLIGEEDLSSFVEKFSINFNVLQIENIYYSLLSRDNIENLIPKDGYNELIRLYVKRIRAIMPENGVISLLMGFSLGGSIAYDIACEWVNLTGQKPVVVMGDSYLHISSGEECGSVQNCNPDQWWKHLCETYGKTDECLDELLYSIRYNRKAIRSYEGKAIMLHAIHGHKINVDVKEKMKDGFLYRAIRWIYWHFHIRDIVLSNRVSKTNVFEAGFRRQSRDNITIWKRYKPDMEIIDIDSTHNGLFYDKDLIPQYEQIIGRALESQ